MMQVPLTPRPAATLVLVRDSRNGMEVLMVQRSHRAAFIPGGYVFPGGAVDPEDSDPAFLDCISGMDDARASSILNLERDGLAFWIAALRECFEEAGLLLAYDGNGKLVGKDSSAAIERVRAEIANGNGNFIALCRNFGLQLALDRMNYFAHWTTQLKAPRRFTTRFFAAVAPGGQTVSHDQTETIHHLWINPSEALERHRSGQMPMAFATSKTLEMLSMFNEADAFIAHVRTIKSPPLLFPRFARRGTSECILLDDHPAYAEIGKLDRTGAGTFSCEIVPGEVTQISDRVRRLTAPNAGIMTGPGTNTYVLGMTEEFAVIDPGPADDAHMDRLLAITDGRIRWILVTHTHLDHSSAAARIKERTGARLLGMPANHHEWQDNGFHPDIALEDGEILEIAGCRLSAVHTPGHASNHVCYFLHDENLLFTGDHIMQGSTVVINPPDGDMAAYIQSLSKIKNLNADYLAPGHGFLMDRPGQVVERLLRHRLGREQKIIESLSRIEMGRLGDLVLLAYDDVPEYKHRAASRSLLAHLLKLRAEGRVTESNDAWTLASDSI